PGVERFGLKPFDVAAAVDGVKQALGEIPVCILADVPGSDGPPTLDAICARLTDQSYTLLHLVCHGLYDPDERRTLLFLNDRDREDNLAPVSDQALIDRLSDQGGVEGLPHFAFLCACESGTAEAARAGSSLAHRLVRDLGMPAVVAMTE